MREGLVAREAHEDNIKNDLIYVEGNKEMEANIEEVEEEMEDNIEMEEGKDESSSDSSKKEKEASQKIWRKTQAKG